VPLAAILAAAGEFQDRLLTLCTRNSAAYKGIYALTMRGGCRDWMKNHELSMASFFDYKVDIHHVFPKAWCAANGVDRNRRESVVNKTALSSVTNVRIGGRSPATYVGLVESTAGISSPAFDEILRSHLIEPAALRAADFDTFFSARTEALLELIGEAMLKAPVRADQATAAESEAPGNFDAEQDELDDDAVVASKASNDGILVTV